MRGKRGKSRRGKRRRGSRDSSGRVMGKMMITMGEGEKKEIEGAESTVGIRHKGFQNG